MKSIFFTTLIIMVAVLGTYYFMGQPHKIAPDSETVPVKEAVIIYDSMESTDKVTTEARIENFKSDADAIEAVKRCESEKLSLTDCFLRLYKNYAVVGLKPQTVADDGFGGFLVFPLNAEETVILDYNTKDATKNFIYFGDFNDLKKEVHKEGFDPIFQERVNKVEKVIPRAIN